MMLNSPSTDECILSDRNMSLYRIGLGRLSEFTKFVFDMYSRHYSKHYQWVATEHDLQLMRESDFQHFPNSVYLAFHCEQHQILGTIKATRKNTEFKFPFDSEFKVDIDQMIRERNLVPQEIWHLGRLAIDSNRLRKEGIPISSREMIRLLLSESFAVIAQDPSNLMIAESDILVYEMLIDMGINMQIVGDLRYCLGSPTYPVVVTGEDLQSWLQSQSIYG